jgi:integrase
LISRQIDGICDGIRNNSSENTVMLTDAKVRAARPKGSPYKLADGGGMYLLVGADGARYWRMDYRFDGKRKTLALGVYPGVSVADARDKHRIEKKLLEQGTDPGYQRKLEKYAARTAAENTFKSVSDEYIDKLKREGRSPTTLKKKRWLLGFALSELGGRPIAAVTAPGLLAALRKIEARGCYETARRARSACGEVFRYAIATGRAARDPSGDLRGALTAPTVRHRAAVTEPKAIGELLRAIDSYTGQPTTAAALRLAPLVFVRPGELRQAEWAEFDLDAGMWTIPAGKMKMRRPHLVPLSRQAVAILRELHALTGRDRYLFPSLRTVTRCMSENTVNAALRRLGYSKDEMTGHGFRSMASTRLNKMGRWNSDAIERQLAHEEENAIRRAYISQAGYLSERREMMQAWADYLDTLRREAQVIRFDRSA